ncbi:hypothetical protein PMAYCL1PPCAC_13726, partial [Pristionchus mayeri]
EVYAQFTNNKLDVYSSVQQAYKIDGLKYFKEYCSYTPQKHRILRKLLKVDIRFRILDDLIKMKFISMVPFNFCDRDYLLSKCICDEGSSAAFCNGFFWKHAALLFLNECM